MQDIARLGLAVDSRQARTAAGDLDGLTAASRRTEQAIGMLPPRMASAANNMRMLVTSGAALTSALVGITAVVGTQAVRAFMELEEEQARYNAVLRATGLQSGRTGDDIEELASSIRRSSAVTEGEVRKAAAVLATFTGVAGEQFDQALTLSRDLTVVMGGDMASAARVLGRALENPAEGMTMLRRAGVQLSEAQKRQIRDFSETGQSAKATQIILDEMARRVGGAGAAQAGTISGAFVQLNEATNNWLELVGSKIANATRLRDVMQGIAGIIDRTNKSIEVSDTAQGRLAAIDARLAELRARPPSMVPGIDAQRAKEIARLEERRAKAANEVADAERRAADERKRADEGEAAAAAKRRADAIEAVTGKLQDEQQELRKSALQREIDNAVRKAGLDLSTAEGQAAQKRIEEQVKTNFYLREGSQLYQQRVALLGDAASVEEVARAKRMALNDAIKQGANLTKEEVEGIVDRARAAALGTSSLQAQTDALRIEAATLGMSVGAAREYEAVANAINEARRNGRTLTAENIAAIRAEAAALGESAERLEALRFGHESFRSLFSDFSQALRSSNSELKLTARLMEAAKTAGMNFLNRISDKLMQMAADKMWMAAIGLLNPTGVTHTPWGYSQAFPKPIGSPVAHSGGIIGVDAFPTRYVHPAYFENAPRYHGGGIAGLRPDEVPAILQKGETVLPRGGAPTTKIEIINRTSERVRAREGGSRQEGGVDIKTIVIEPILEDLATNGPVARMLENTHGLRRRV